MPSAKEPSPSGLRMGNAVQIGAVVRDIERAIEALQSLLGVGPVRRAEWPPPCSGIEGTYRGHPGDFSMSLAFAELGPIQLELVQPLRGDSIYRDFLESKGQGLHHLLFDVSDIHAAAARLQARGIEVLQSGSGLVEGTQWAYFDTEETLGFVVEVRG